MKLRPESRAVTDVNGFSQGNWQRIALIYIYIHINALRVEQQLAAKPHHQQVRLPLSCYDSNLTVLTLNLPLSCK